MNWPRMMIREAGKPWCEADADVCEAIDFCEYLRPHGGRPVRAASAWGVSSAS